MNSITETHAACLEQHPGKVQIQEDDQRCWAAEDMDAEVPPTSGKVHTDLESDRFDPRPRLEELLTCAIRNPAVFQMAQSTLGPQSFTGYTYDLRSLWDMVKTIVMDYGGREVLGRGDFRFILEDRLSKGSRSQQRLLKSDFLNRVFSTPIESLSEAKGGWLLRQVTYEANVLEPLYLLTGTGLADRDPNEVLAILAKIVERSSSATTGQTPLFMSPEDFATEEFKLDWLIPKVLVADQPCIVGGPSKAMKTGTMIDLAISIGAGNGAAFLGHFPVKHDGKRVGFISGESGGATIQETFKRVCRSRGIELAKCNVYPEFQLPKLSQAAELRNLASQVRARGLQVLILDPVYLSLLAGNTSAKAMNLFDMGPLLSNVTQTCLEAGATPILVHHTVKRPGGGNGFTGQFEPIDREDLAMTGFSEFARQWLLINRREAYVDGSGRHELWLRVGGSVGFGGLHAVTIAEGTIGEDFTGRTWNVRVTSADKVHQERARKKDELKLAKAEEKRQSDKHKLVGALLRFPEGETATVLRNTALLGRNDSAVALLDELVQEGLAESVLIKKPAGRGTRDQPGYKPSWSAKAFYTTPKPASTLQGRPGAAGAPATPPANDTPVLDLAV